MRIKKYIFGLCPSAEINFCPLSGKNLGTPVYLRDEGRADELLMSFTMTHIAEVELHPDSYSAQSSFTPTHRAAVELLGDSYSRSQASQTANKVLAV